MAQNSRTLAPLSCLFLCIFLISCTPKKELQPALLSQLGDSAATQNEPREAASLYLRALKAEPQNNDIRLKLLRLYLQGKNHADILQHTQNLALTDSTIDHIRIRAIAFDLTGQHRKAQETYKEILNLSPHDDKTHMNLILSYQLSRNSEAAKTHKKNCKARMSTRYQEKLELICP